VQDERQPLGRGQRVEHHEEREADRVGQQGLVLGLELALKADDGVGDVHIQGLLASSPSRAQHVQAHARDDRRQPSTEVLDLVRARSAHA
jgi:hypothetical protein